MEANSWRQIFSNWENEIMNVLGAEEKQLGYGVTANIAASHIARLSQRHEISQSGCDGRGSSGFDSPYPNIFFCLLTINKGSNAGRALGMESSG